MAGIVDQIKSAASRLGFDLAGVSRIEPFTRDAEALFAWCEAGHAAGMDYMSRRPDLLADPSQLAPHTLSIIALAVNYYSPVPEFHHEHRFGRIARYAWGLDYHDVVKPRLARLGQQLSGIAGREVRWRAFVDAVPLLERAAAARAGLGFFGKNTNLLQPRRGSWFFIAELLVDIDLPADAPEIRISCGSCHRCLDACPTDAFAGPYVLDSRRCISYLTIENKGSISRQLREGLGEWVFGCDVCQEVCPFNRFSSGRAWDELSPEAGPGPLLDLCDVLAIETTEEFRARFAGTALMRPRRRGLLRNAAVVAANVGCTASVPMLTERVEHDPEPLIRSHALWALSKLDPPRAILLAQRALRQDPDHSVQREASECLSIEN
ncbi:MAG TPA: tRNA epoxyqueuosine(34) reductase QueG [Blastocatellia bacterium]|nr:tRNA epoxyqueuosine(34) reductase QueG [Blastocatellia bacterium]